MNGPGGRPAGADARDGAALDADEVIRLLGLEPLPIEGGLYREIWRSAVRIPASALPAVYGGERAAGTAIHYLLTPDTISALHRLPTDEIYHFLMGDPVEMLMLAPEAAPARVTLGHDLRAGQRVQHVVPAGVWQGSRLARGGRWALMGVTVAPGFELGDYEAGDRDALCAEWPSAAAEIEALSR